MSLGGSELVILLIIVVVIFGGSWLPKAARNLGRAKVEVDKAQRQLADTKAQVVEATGLDAADAALKKANRALNQSPQSLMKQAMAPSPKPDPTPELPDPVESDGESTINIDFE